MITLSANELLSLMPQLDNLPIFIKDINKENAQDIQEYLGAFYDLDTKIIFFVRGSEVITLKKLSSQNFASEAKALLLPKHSYKKDRYTFGDLCRIMTILTGKVGCPWDIKQTHQSIRTNMIEEAYEAVSAIDAGDKQNLIEELGDVMLQSIFHADIARRAGEFQLSDVISRLSNKLVSRHTHIFGEDKAENEQQALKNWEDAKESEQGIGKIKDYLGFPALLRAQKIIKKLPDSSTDNSLVEVSSSTDFGKLLFDCVVACVQYGIDAEVELNKYLNSLINKTQNNNE